MLVISNKSLQKEKNVMLIGRVADARGPKPRELFHAVLRGPVDSAAYAGDTRLVHRISYAARSCAVNRELNAGLTNYSLLYPDVL